MENYLIGEEYYHDIVHKFIMLFSDKLFGKNHKESNMYIFLGCQIHRIKSKSHLPFECNYRYFFVCPCLFKLDTNEVKADI